MKLSLLSSVDFIHQSVNLVLDLLLEESQLFSVLLLFRLSLLVFLLNLQLDLFDLLQQLILHLRGLTPPLVIVSAPLVQMAEMCLEQVLLAVEDLPLETEQGRSKLVGVLVFLLLQLLHVLILLQEAVNLGQLVQVHDWGCRESRGEE